jgi:hypothetical protein
MSLVARDADGVHLPDDHDPRDPHVYAAEDDRFLFAGPLPEPAPFRHRARLERHDEPDLRERILDALQTAELYPVRDYRTEMCGPTVRIAFVGPTPDAAWDALLGYDVASDGPTALRIGYRGEFSQVAA